MIWKYGRIAENGSFAHTFVDTFVHLGIAVTFFVQFCFHYKRRFKKVGIFLLVGEGKKKKVVFKIILTQSFRFFPLPKLQKTKLS